MNRQSNSNRSLRLDFDVLRSRVANQSQRIKSLESQIDTYITEIRKLTDYLTMNQTITTHSGES